MVVVSDPFRGVGKWSAYHSSLGLAPSKYQWPPGVLHGPHPNYRVLISNNMMINVHEKCQLVKVCFYSYLHSSSKKSDAILSLQDSPHRQSDWEKTLKYSHVTKTKAFSFTKQFSKNITTSKQSYTVYIYIIYIHKYLKNTRHRRTDTFFPSESMGSPHALPILQSYRPSWQGPHIKAIKMLPLVDSERLPNFAMIIIISPYAPNGMWIFIKPFPLECGHVSPNLGI